MSETAKNENRANVVSEEDDRESVDLAAASSGAEESEQEEPSEERSKFEWANVRCQRWVFTGWCDNRTDLHRRLKAYTYVVYQQESAPKTGRLHWQGFVYHVNGLKGSTLAKAVKGWVAPARGTTKQAVAYCTKTDTRKAGPWTIGKQPVGQGKRSDLDDLAKKVREGAPLLQIAQDHPKQMILYQRGIEGLSGYLSEPVSRARKVVDLMHVDSVSEAVYWIDLVSTGEPSYYIAPGNLERKSGDWHGYRGQSHLILEGDRWKGEWDWMLHTRTPPLKIGFQSYYPCWETVWYVPPTTTEDFRMRMEVRLAGGKENFQVLCNNESKMKEEKKARLEKKSPLKSALKVRFEEPVEVCQDEPEARLEPEDLALDLETKYDEERKRLSCSEELEEYDSEDELAEDLKEAGYVAPAERTPLPKSKKQEQVEEAEKRLPPAPDLMKITAELSPTRASNV